MEKINIVFFGTHDFAATILEGLLQDNRFTISTVFTQPDRKVGRKQIIEQSPVKKIASLHNIPTIQPESLKNIEMPQVDAKLAVVAQYGLIIPQRIIDSFSDGMINVHGSVLPAYRGASPIQAALKNGDAHTGVTIMIMDEKVDHGPTLADAVVTIDPDDTYTTLSQKIATVGARLLVDTLPAYLEKKITPQTQQHDQATFTTLINKEDGKINFSQSAQQIYNTYRAYTPWPGIWCMWKDKRVKLLHIAMADKNIPPGAVEIAQKRLFVGCGEQAIEILELQLEGKNAMPAEMFCNGYQHMHDIIFT